MTDPHITGVSPKSRKDDYFTTIKEKLVEVGQIAKANKVSAILCGGDIFNRPDPSPSVVIDIFRIIKAWDVPLYGVIGNHDIFGFNPETVGRTMLGVLMSSGLYNPLGDDNWVEFANCDDFNDNDFTVGISGCDSYYGLDKGGRTEDYSPNNPMGSVKIHIVHGYLSAKKRLETIPHTMIDDILDTKADIVLAGHEHEGFGVIKRNNKLFCNPGALGRVSAAVGEINRDVRVALVIVNGPGDFDIRLIPLKCAKPADEVLDREQLEKEKEQQEQMAVFAQSISDFEVKTTDILEIMQLIADEENKQHGDIRMSTAVVNEARRRIEKAHIAVGGNIDGGD